MTHRYRYPTVPALVFALFSIACAPLLAQKIRQPEPAPLPPPIAAPRDQPYAGTIRLLADTTDVQGRVIKVQETIPVRPGKLTLLYPAWIPGDHAPTGPISKVAGLFITANGKRLPWVRDRVNVYAFRVTVPPGASTLDVKFQFLTRLRAIKGDGGRISFSSQMLDLAWNSVALYPAGYFSRDIHFSPSIQLPEGWHFATALEIASQQGNLVHFKTVPFNTLVDSPVYAGANYKRLNLSTGPDNQVFLDVFGDKPSDLAISPKELQLHKNLVVQEQKLFHSHHYKHYDFLFTISEVVGGQGLEHHQSSEDGTYANYFTDWKAGVADRDLLAHEYTHSWNGKFRRPADLWTPNFNVPMQDDLLWVYEGLTQYYGYVLTARSGLRTNPQTRDLIAMIAANFVASPGRKWRPLVDTTNQEIISERRPVTWVSWQRTEAYYNEGLMIWLDADTLIRKLSGGKKSLDDFAKLFYGIDNGSYVTQTYTLKDIVSALNEVQPYDWGKFFQSRVYDLAPQTPEEGITRGGYRLAYSDTPPNWLKYEKRPDRTFDFATSIGISIKKDGTLDNVWWGSPAFKAGITPDMKLVAVNGVQFKVKVLRSAIKAAEKSKAPLKLLVQRDKNFQTISLDYHKGLRYPKLDRVKGTPDRLDAILAPVQ
ncbi:MAG: M61 family metallopeptidase [Bryobacteraceae bacterium]